jgi:hypothetical protein
VDDAGFAEFYRKSFLLALSHIFLETLHKKAKPVKRSPSVNSTKTLPAKITNI